MLSRLFALLVLVVLIGGGLYYWSLERRGVRAPDSLGELGDRIGDAKTTGTVKGALALNRQLRPYSLEVETEDGVVVLRGRVPSDEVRTLAEEVAGAVPDVRQVVNHLRVSESAAASTGESTSRSLGESLDDHKLALEVKLAFSLRRELKGTDVDVTAFRREVTLGGAVADEDQRRLAVRVARDVPGVTGVVDRIRLRGAADGGVDAEAVRRALADSPSLESGGIHVELDGDLVVLSGHVRSGAEKELATLLARSATRRSVDDRLEIRH